VVVNILYAMVYESEKPTGDLVLIVILVICLYFGETSFINSHELESLENNILETKFKIVHFEVLVIGIWSRPLE